MDPSLAIKLFLAPLLILAATLISRRWGPGAAGLFAGLPLTSGPISLVLFLLHGPAFAGRAAVGVLAGLEAVIVFCWVYARVARAISVAAALLVSILAYACVTGVLLAAPQLGLLPTVGLLVATLVAALATLPAAAAPEAPLRRGESFDVIVRMALASAMVFALTESSAALGPRLTGILSPFPLFAAVMAGFTHRQDGAGAVVELIRGLLRSTGAFMAFFLVLAVLLPAHVAAAYPSATVSALILQTLSVILRRLRRGAAPTRGLTVEPADELATSRRVEAGLDLHRQRHSP